eukprot:4294984-Amphidinium_carterae.1
MAAQWRHSHLTVREGRVQQHPGSLRLTLQALGRNSALNDNLLRLMRFHPAEVHVRRHGYSRTFLKFPMASFPVFVAVLRGARGQNDPLAVADELVGPAFFQSGPPLA